MNTRFRINSTKHDYANPVVQKASPSPKHHALDALFKSDEEISRQRERKRMEAQEQFLEQQLADPVKLVPAQSEKSEKSEKIETEKKPEETAAAEPQQATPEEVKMSYTYQECVKIAGKYMDGDGWRKHDPKSHAFATQNGWNRRIGKDASELRIEKFGNEFLQRRKKLSDRQRKAKAARNGTSARRSPAAPPRVRSEGVETSFAKNTLSVKFDDQLMLKLQLAANLATKSTENYLKEILEPTVNKVLHSQLAATLE